MRIPRIYLPQRLETNSEISLDARSAHYLASVLRMKPGMAIMAFDGSGMEFPATLLEISKKTGLVSLGAATNPGTESTLETHLGIGISRGERMDYVIQKSTELGINVIQPLLTEHCEVKLDDKRADKRRAHWQQISISACEQSGRVIPPTVHAPLSLKQWLDQNGCQYKFLLDQEQHEQLEGTLDGKPDPKSIAILIGPEGGISDNEKALAKDKGFSGVNLGPRILRTETAPVVALSLLQYLWGH